jgi:hypothetical protein
VNSYFIRICIVFGVGYGMEMDSYKSQILDGVLMGSGTKTKLYKPVSQIACASVSIFFVLNVHIPTYLDSRGKHFFETLSFFLLCLPIVD